MAKHREPRTNRENLQCSKSQLGGDCRAKTQKYTLVLSFLSYNVIFSVIWIFYFPKIVVASPICYLLTLSYLSCSGLRKI